MERELSPENTEILVRFQELSEIDDLTRCREILERHNWDLETAIHDHLDLDPRGMAQPAREIPNFPQHNGQNGQSTLNSSLRGNSNRPQPVTSLLQRIMTSFVSPFLDENGGLWPLPNQQPQGFTGWLLFASTLPLRIVVVTFYHFTNFVLKMIRPEHRPAITDPTGNVVSFINQYNEIFGDQHPTFFAGTYSQVLNEAKKDLKFLLVYLHCKDHQDTNKFCRQTLSNPEVIEFINSNCLIIDGFIEPENLIQRLRTTISDNEAFLVAARADREERSFNQALRQEQDQAYLESLKADQEKEEKKRRERLLEEERLREIRELELAEERKKEDLYYFILAHPDSPYQFEMATSFPKRTLPWEPEMETYPTLAELGFGASEALLVLDLDA
nr:EOG090X0B12 [Simocephalus serrulatus]